MLSEKASLVLDFIEECRNKLMIKDDYHNTVENMYTKLYQVQDLLKTTEEGKKLFNELQELIMDTITLAKETYFEYGENFNGINENRFFKFKHKEAV